MEELYFNPLVRKPLFFIDFIKVNNLINLKSTEPESNILK
jgi:hypothetical protein